MRTFLIATKNFGKLAEFKALLRDFDCEIISAADIDIQEIDENGTTFEENALIKARAASCVVQDRGYYVIGDDSGLCVHALNNRPGIYSARYAPNGDFKLGRLKLLHEMSLLCSDDRSAHFTCAIALIEPNGSYNSFIGEVFGKISSQERGKNGFGYDSIFIPEGYEHTFGEMDTSFKDTISHRAKAFEQLKNYLLSNRD